MDPVTLKILLFLATIAVATLGYFIKKRLEKIETLEKRVDSINNKVIVINNQVDDLKIMIQTLSNMDKKINNIHTSVELIKKDMEYLARDNIDNKDKLKELDKLNRRKDDQE